VTAGREKIAIDKHERALGRRRCQRAAPAEGDFAPGLKLLIRRVAAVFPQRPSNVVDDWMVPSAS
jgi:hypothetical protein